MICTQGRRTHVYNAEDIGFSNKGSFAQLDSFPLNKKGECINATVIKIDLITVLTFILSIKIIDGVILQRTDNGLHNSIRSFLD